MEDIQVNGSKISWSQLSAIVMMAFWLGGLTWTVASNADDIKNHVTKPSHEPAETTHAILDSRTTQTEKEVEALKAKLEEMDKKREQDTKEILKAIGAIRN